MRFCQIWHVLLWCTVFNYNLIQYHFPKESALCLNETHHVSVSLWNSLHIWQMYIQLDSWMKGWDFGCPRLRLQWAHVHPISGTLGGNFISSRISLAAARAMSTWTQGRDDQKLEVITHCDLNRTFVIIIYTRDEQFQQKTLLWTSFSTISQEQKGEKKWTLFPFRSAPLFCTPCVFC